MTELRLFTQKTMASYFGVVQGDAERAPIYFSQMRMEEGLLRYMQGSPELRLPEAFLGAQGFTLQNAGHIPGCSMRELIAHASPTTCGAVCARSPLVPLLLKWSPSSALASTLSLLPPLSPPLAEDLELHPCSSPRRALRCAPLWGPSSW